ncbi:lipopolysaccharide-induced tumor necrosis factor-alpha factor homolog [Triplophysa rosa]|uniref:Lipopolysaccharide-induced tumor necrosis factor-alpha factor-like protein n=1 Tax=Triplophysa rosa TaxID=992332 RepID=A0A9W7WYX4_TRIRA|nr:lipopolysaccharide-induced tumor necrosis factor-alpha factor homolog [Triplophysa rosa]KAI7810769.1 putative lipopolysaccharide-induced tumor necrosis factor-alpha factor-like protein [Triplophysa rosa]
MDTPSYPAADTTTPRSPPPSYHDINALAIFEGLPAKPPPPYSEATYSEATAPPIDTNQQQANRFPSGAQADQFPVLNMPRVVVVNHTEQVIVRQQIVKNEAPQVIVVQPQQMVLALGDTQTATVCKYCHNSILTVVEYKPGCAAWAMCILLTVLGLVCGFCLIPFCVRGFQDAHHSCPQCRRHLGIYRRK